MVKFKNAIFITTIGLVVLLSGCTGTQQSQVSGTTQPTTAVQIAIVQTPAVQTSDYQLALEVKTLQDCIVSGTKQLCSEVNLDVKNNNPQSLDVAVVKNTLVLKGGRSLIMYDSQGGLSTACVRKTGLQFKLSANSNQNLAMCYSLFQKSDAPTLDLGIMINGERKDYSFDLTQYGLTD
jgi:hypothetical protein